jgi:hypothetical protein
MKSRKDFLGSAHVEPPNQQRLLPLPGVASNAHALSVATVNTGVKQTREAVGSLSNVHVERPAADPSARAAEGSDYSLDELARSALYPPRSAPTKVRPRSL